MLRDRVLTSCAPARSLDRAAGRMAVGRTAPLRTLAAVSTIVALAACGKSNAQRTPSSRTVDPRTATYIGYEYEGVPPHHTLPNGVLNSGGSLIGNPPADPMFAIEWMSRDSVNMLWLVQSIGGASRHVPSRHVRWHVDDVLDVPALPKGESMIWDASCAINGRGDPEIVAAVVETNTEQYTQIVRAWRADRKARAFRPIGTTGVSCANTGYGAED